VVTRLFHLVGCELAVFGEKDAQQLAVVRRLVRDLHLPVEIVAHPTVREADGLAMSSRNARLDPAARRAAAALHRALAAGAEEVGRGARDADAVRRAMRRVLAAEPGAAVEYAEVVDAETFRPLERLPAAGRIVLPLAVRLGGVRLIDNLQLDVSPLDLPHVDLSQLEPTQPDLPPDRGAGRSPAAVETTPPAFP
jgi:pantoate--beta-alanine ligase